MFNNETSQNKKRDAVKSKYCSQWIAVVLVFLPFYDIAEYNLIVE